MDTETLIAAVDSNPLCTRNIKFHHALSPEHHGNTLRLAYIVEDRVLLVREVNERDIRIIDELRVFSTQSHLLLVLVVVVYPTDCVSIASDF